MSRASRYEEGSDRGALRLMNPFCILRCGSKAALVRALPSGAWWSTSDGLSLIATSVFRITLGRSGARTGQMCNRHLFTPFKNLCGDV